MTTPPKQIQIQQKYLRSQLLGLASLASCKDCAVLVFPLLLWFLAGIEHCWCFHCAATLAVCSCPVPVEHCLSQCPPTLQVLFSFISASCWVAAHRNWCECLHEEVGALPWRGILITNFPRSSGPCTSGSTLIFIPIFSLWFSTYDVNTATGYKWRKNKHHSVRKVSDLVYFAKTW